MTTANEIPYRLLEIEFPDTIGNLSSNLSHSAIAEGFAALRGPLFFCLEKNVVSGP